MIIKDSCEDFLVTENIDKSILSEQSTRFHVYKLKKTNYTTERAVNQLSRSLRIPRKAISYAGTKDKNAITTQYITLSGVPKEKVALIELKDISLEFFGYAKRHLSLGDLEGNSFVIKIKNVQKRPVDSRFYVPNYFDEQRFSKNNIPLGIALLQNKFDEACNILIDDDEDFGPLVVEHLKNKTNDYVGALQIIPRKIRTFYVHAVQSMLFNQELAKQITSEYDSFDVSIANHTLSFPVQTVTSIEQSTIELPGYDYKGKLPWGTPRELFTSRQFVELNLEGTKREKWSYVRDCEIREENDDVVISFTLGKGSYATIVLKALFANQ